MRCLTLDAAFGDVNHRRTTLRRPASRSAHRSSAVMRMPAWNHEPASVVWRKTCQWRRFVLTLDRDIKGQHGGRWVWRMIPGGRKRLRTLADGVTMHPVARVPNSNEQPIRIAGIRGRAWRESMNRLVAALAAVLALAAPNALAETFLLGNVGLARSQGADPNATSAAISAEAIRFGDRGDRLYVAGGVSASYLTNPVKDFVGYSLGGAIGATFGVATPFIGVSGLRLSDGYANEYGLDNEWDFSYGIGSHFDIGRDLRLTTTINGFGTPQKAFGIGLLGGDRLAWTAGVSYVDSPRVWGIGGGLGYRF